NNLDLLASNGTQQRVEIYRGNGDRSFQAPEFFSTASAGSAFSLATADFDRDGQPDFLSGSSDSGTLLLTTSGLADVEVLPQELVVTGFTNVTMQVTNPLGFSTSENIQTVAGADIWRLDANFDDTLDEQIVDYNLIDGNYILTFYLRPEFVAANSRALSTLSGSVRINGSQEATIFSDLSFGSFEKFENFSVISCYTDSVVFIINPLIVDSTSTLLPRFGIQTESYLPRFDWKDLNFNKSGFVTSYHFQIDTLLDFASPIFEDSSLVRTALCDGELRGIIDPDRLYYWRARLFDGISWSDYSNTMVAYIGVGEPCCVGPRGDLNGDGTEANILDLVFLVDLIFRAGPKPDCFEEADVNADCKVDILDLTFQVDYIFRGGAGPGPCP
ncbi:MAG: FG-GAP-like repeat-containing protein, partial [candidate division Zixibacteria bacterium]